MTFADVRPGRRIRARHILELQESVDGFQAQLDALPGEAQLVNMRSGIVYLLDHDPDTSGATDSLEAWNSAIAAMEPGDTLDIGNGNTFNLTDTPVFTQSFRMIGNSTITYPINKTGMRVTPPWATAHAITSQATAVYPPTIGRNCAKLGVTEWADYARGDIVVVSSTDAIPTADGVVGQKGAAYMVAGVETGYVWLVGMLDDAYTTSATIRKHPMCVVDIDGPTFTADGDITVNTGGRGRAALELNGCANSRVRATFSNCWSRGLFVVSCYGCDFDVVARNLRDDAANGAYGYGIDICCACRVCTVKINATNCRHGVTTNIYTAVSGDGFVGSPRNILFHDSFVDACSSTSFDTHGGTYDITFDNCHAVNNNVGPAGASGSYDAFVVRAANVTIQNCSQTGLGNFLYDWGASTNYGIETVTRVVNCYARTTDAQYAKEADRALLRSAGTTHAHRIEFINCETYNRDIYDTQGIATVTFDGCLLRNADLIRIRDGATMEIRNTRRTWEIAGSMEPILLRAGSTLKLHGYQTEGTHTNTSIVRGVGGPGTWTVQGAFVSSPDTSTFKSDDGTGTWSVTDIARTVS